MTSISSPNQLISAQTELPGMTTGITPGQKVQPGAFKAAMAKASAGGPGHFGSSAVSFKKLLNHKTGLKPDPNQHLPFSGSDGKESLLLAADEPASISNHPNVIHAKEVEIEDMAKAVLGDDFELKRLVVWNTLPAIMKPQQEALERVLRQRGVEVIVLGTNELAEASRYFDSNTVFMPLFSYDRDRSLILTDAVGIPTINGTADNPDLIKRWADVLTFPEKPGLVILCGCNTDNVLTPSDERISLGEVLSQQTQLPVIDFHGLVKINERGKIDRPLYAKPGRSDAYLHIPDAPSSRISRLRLKESERRTEQPVAESQSASSAEQIRAQRIERFSGFDELTRTDRYQQLSPELQYNAAAAYFGFADGNGMSIFEAIHGHLNLRGAEFVNTPDALLAEIQSLQPEDAADALSEMYYTFFHEPHLAYGNPDNATDITNINSIVTVNMKPGRLSDLSNLTQVLDTAMHEWNTTAVEFIEDPDMRSFNAFLRGDNIVAENLVNIWLRNLLTMGVFHSNLDQQAYRDFAGLYDTAIEAAQSNRPVLQSQGRTALNLARTVMHEVLARNYKTVTAEEMQAQYRWGEAIRRAAGADVLYRETATQWLQAPSADLQTVSNITLRLWQWAEQTDMPHPQRVKDIYQTIVQNNEYPLDEFINAARQANLTNDYIRGHISAADYIRRRLPAESAQGLSDTQLLAPETVQNAKFLTAPPMRPATGGNDQAPDSGLQSQFGTLEWPGNDTNKGSTFSTTSGLRLDPYINPNGLIGNDGTQAGHNGGKDGNGINTAVVSSEDDNPFSNSIPDYVPLELQSGLGNMTIPEQVPNWMKLPIDPDRPIAPAGEVGNSVADANSKTPATARQPGGKTSGGELGSPSEAEKARRQMEELFGKGWSQGVRPDLFPTAINSRIPGFGEGLPQPSLDDYNTGWGIPDIKIEPTTERFPQSDPALDNILKPNGPAGPDFTFPPGTERDHLPEVPESVQQALIKALPELQKINYAQYSQLSIADQQQILKRIVAYQQLSPANKAKVSLVDYLDSTKTSDTQRRQLSHLDGQQTVQQTTLKAIAARTGLTENTVELINSRIKALQTNIAQLNQHTQGLQQNNAERLIKLSVRAKTDPIGVAFIKPKSIQDSVETEPVFNRVANNPATAVPRFMVIRTENGPQLIENLLNGQTQMHFLPLAAGTPITRQLSDGRWSGVPDVGQIGGKLFLDLLFTQGVLKMLNNGGPVQAPAVRSVPQGASSPQPSL